MDDLTAKITQLLQDPEGMETIKNIAQSFMAQNNDNEQTNKTNGNAGVMPELPFSPMQMGAIMNAINSFKNSGDDSQTALLLALKPHLNEERQKKTDNAIKIMKLIKVLPLLKDSGILSILGG